MSEYVPTTGHVQDAYCHVQQGVMGERGDAAHEKFHAEFDRWLAAHDAEVAAKAWDEGYQDLWRDGGREGNPYRKAVD